MESRGTLQFGHRRIHRIGMLPALFICLILSLAAFADSTIADTTRLIEANPKDASAYYGRGRAYYTGEQYEEAITDYSKAISAVS